MPTESLTQKWAKKAKKPNPTGGGTARDKKLNEAEKKATATGKAKRMK